MWRLILLLLSIILSVYALEIIIVNVSSERSRSARPYGPLVRRAYSYKPFARCPGALEWIRGGNLKLEPSAAAKYDATSRHLECRDIVMTFTKADFEEYSAKLVNPRRELERQFVFIVGFPFTGTSALSGLLASSPHVDQMSHNRHWQHEGSKLLVDKGVIVDDTEWIAFGNTTYPWEEAFHLWHADAWDLTKAILLDKSPNTIALTGSLVEFIKKHQLPAKFVLLVRDPCLRSRVAWWDQSLMLRDALENIPVDDRIIVSYEDLILEPYATALRLQAFLPQLGTLDPEAGSGTQGIRGQSLIAYRASDSCRMNISDTPHTTFSSLYSVEQPVLCNIERQLDGEHDHKYKERALIAMRECLKQSTSENVLYQRVEQPEGAAA